MVTIENGLYVVKDETQTSYLSKIDLFGSYLWETRWDKFLNLVYFYEHNYGTNMLLALENPNHIDYYKAIRAKSRHLKKLREQGYYALDEVREDKPKPKIKKVIYQGVGDKLLIADKTAVPFGLKSSEYTEEKELLVEEYNRKLEEFEKYSQEIKDKIFKS